MLWNNDTCTDIFIFYLIADFEYHFIYNHIIQELFNSHQVYKKKI